MSMEEYTMTVNKLLELCHIVVAAGHGRAKVCADKPTFTHPLEDDGAVILDVSTAGVESVVQMDDDGGTKTDSRGRECYRTCFVLRGHNYEPPKERA